MALTMRGKSRYGENQADICDELSRYGKVSGYEVHQFADAKCACGCRVFQLKIDDTEGAAVRICLACSIEHAIGDSVEYLAEAELEECACPCGTEELEITVGVSLYPESDDVRWIYLGCRCPKCGLVGVYGDWKNEFSDYRKLLDRV